MKFSMSFLLVYMQFFIHKYIAAALYRALYIYTHTYVSVCVCCLLV